MKSHTVKKGFKTVKEVMQALDMNPQNNEGIIGLQYSIFTWSETVKKLETFADKLFANGHAECFMVERGADNSLSYVTCSVAGSEKGDYYCFRQEGDDGNWLKDTEATDTFVYFVEADSDDIKNFKATKEDMDGKSVKYSVLHPNLPCNPIPFENCVSSSHTVLEKAGIGWPHKGWWMPSIDSWMEWFAGKIPFNRHKGNNWLYKKLPSTNCFWEE